MLTWIKNRLRRYISRHAGMDEQAILLQGWVPYPWIADFVIARTTYRDKVQRICLIKTAKGEMWEIRDAE